MKRTFLFLLVTVVAWVVALITSEKSFFLVLALAGAALSGAAMAMALSKAAANGDEIMASGLQDPTSTGCLTGQPQQHECPETNQDMAGTARQNLIESTEVPGRASLGFWLGFHGVVRRQ